MVGTNDNLFFMMASLAEQERKYFMLGQLTGLDIIHIGRGPECFNETLWRSMYGLPYLPTEEIG